MGAKVKLLSMLTSTLHTPSHVVLMANVLFEQLFYLFLNSNRYYVDQNVSYQFSANSDGFRKNYDFNFL